MGKLVEAVRAKNGGKLDADQERFVQSVEEAYLAEIKTESEEIQRRHTQAMTEALNKTIGILPKGKNGEDTTIVEQMRGMAEKLDKIESMSTRKLSVEEKFQLRGQLEKRHAEIVKAVREKQEIEINFDAKRAPQVMTTKNTVTGVDVSTAMNLEWDNEITYLRYPKNFVLDIIRNRQRAWVPETKVKREQATEEGQAEIVEEGGIKPLVSFTFKDEIYKRVKIAAHIEWTEEFQNDFEELFNAVVELFERKVLREWQDYLLEEILDNAAPYISTELDGTIANPNIYSAIAGGILSAQNMGFEPDIIWMRQGTFWGMTFTENANGTYVLPPIMVGNDEVAGLRLYMSNKIPAGKILIGDSTTWSEEHTGFISRMGYIKDQLITNEKTIVGEVFSLMYQAKADQGSWVLIDIDETNALLQKESVAEEAA